MRHPHADIMIQYAENMNLKIQVRENDTQLWGDCSLVGQPAWHPRLQYRIKPEPKKTIGYRRFIHKYQDKYLVSSCWTLKENDLDYIKSIEKNPCFIKWIDTEWQYYEFE